MERFGFDAANVPPRQSSLARVFAVPTQAPPAAGTPKVDSLLERTDHNLHLLCGRLLGTMPEDFDRVPQDLIEEDFALVPGNGV
jgi:hypothetical protein